MALSAPLRKLPIGIQSFEKLRTEGFLYVDKTALVYDLATQGIPYFLSRPRRFGKSLLLSTLEAYFLGKKELFEGLAIAELEKKWTVHPVLHLDLNAEKYDSKERLDGMLDAQLRQWEARYGAEPGQWSSSVRFATVIRKAYEQTGQRVVVLIDEYDKPLLRSFHDETLQQQFRDTLTAFYSVLKSADLYLQFVFITGVTKFAQMGVFSELNQLSDISLTQQYATLCGLTQAEIELNFAPELNALANELKINREQTMEEMKRLYDGYRFYENEQNGVFNPFSVLSALRYQNFKRYWFSTGTPTFLANMLKNTEYDIRDLEGIRLTAEQLSDYRADMRNPVPMIYQSGYLTIKDYDSEFQEYILGFPNEEVRYGFLYFLLPYYAMVNENDTSFHITRFVKELRAGETEAFLRRMRAFFAGIPYELSDESERHYQVIFYLIFRLMGQFTEAEVRSSHGRADAVVKTPDYIYVFEFKLSGTAEEAMQQIDDKGYLIPYTADTRRLIKVAVEFSKETRNAERWIIE